jgi:hypothetical protein
MISKPPSRKGRVLLLFAYIPTFLFLVLLHLGCGALKAGDPHQAWIISPSDGVTRTYCLAVTSGAKALDTLKVTGEALELLTDPVLGTAICKIGDTGWPTTSCFGNSATDPSWLYFLFDGTTSVWKPPGLINPDPNVLSSLDALEVHDGDLLAFVFTSYDQNFEPTRTPPGISFGEICDQN